MLLYDTAIIVLLGAALFQRASLPFACVLFVSMAGNYTLQEMGNAPAVWALDCVVSSAVTALTFKNRKWWSATCAVLVFLAVPLDQWYWTAWATQSPGWDSNLWDAYKFWSCAAYGLAVLTLFVGNHNVPQLAREFLDWFSGPSRAMVDDVGAVLCDGHPWPAQAQKPGSISEPFDG